MINLDIIPQKPFPCPLTYYFKRDARHLMTEDNKKDTPKMTFGNVSSMHIKSTENKTQK